MKYLIGMEKRIIMRNYLVIQLARFGDLVQTKRLVSTLLSRESSEVTLCVDVSLAPLAALVYPKVEVISVRAHGGSDIAGHMRDNLAAFAKLKGRNFDEIFNLNFSTLNFRLASLFEPASVRGYGWDNGQETIDVWPSMAMRWSERRRIGLNLVDFWAGYCIDMVSPDAVNPSAEPKGGGLGVVLAGRESRRSLPADLLAQITAAMARRDNAPNVHLMGGPGETLAGQAVLKQLPADVQRKTVNLAGKTDWRALVQTVSGLDALFTPDTGTMHLAAHLGTPVRAFFLSSAWCFETGPYGLGHTIYQGLTDCLPCLETTPCPYDVKCLEAFNDRKFLRFLVTGKSDHLPNNLMVMQSAFDELGQTYVASQGTDPDIEQRAAFRRFVADYLGVSHAPPSEADEAFARRVYREKDWITNGQTGATLGI